ncbi:30S ribosomal protein S17 [Candidatus Curtissbacteria bacterium RIFCSPLOWO2_01_FULL_39_62]|uniref:Small ribosomal subunit protein uS17 n=2 Tax=Candidatus Curtissiibacteriota TaxID=1752717 RepID=A0A1F5G7I2_9BACT|nr:MAG: 30S ribosomal protein S17 [Candidatus Curtissbacteria bacterium RIFCSPHIGHO2_01_FULL_39_57]OGD87822.1 MAG: 30S ribosomal protein S17 [Candidatus Curtissbacteria bacterium RIFCSPHIGHO2_02_FULL_40_16b]OGD90575.1 MAG: 30S ribosomal protein S17 [Candidatus Curtissbacteria bacterium RIFCSPHIGHO2_12_FULL_38_37]OGD99808.1 MAG: 30S ribosomal protein S17 [Candidatus Curtissbacteria bacterium RIFCSPLOWO2_02_FULL_40_11]OGE01085.1 MAG: 30S ribosomal protein S17 [Candidatus Curtissbacteria bacterium
MPQVKTGTVVSNKMQKTVVVKIEMRAKHPLYKKIITRSKKIKARDELGAKVGQMVKISEVKPISKSVNFKVMEVIK